MSSVVAGIVDSVSDTTSVLATGFVDAVVGFTSVDTEERTGFSSVRIAGLFSFVGTGLFPV